MYLIDLVFYFIFKKKYYSQKKWFCCS